MFRNTWKRCSCHIPVIYYANFSYKVDVPVSHPCMKPCRALFNLMEERRRLFMMEVYIFHYASTNPIPMNYPSPLITRIIVVKVISAGRQTSWIATCVIITRVPHLYVMGSFSQILPLTHDFKCFTYIPDSPHVRPVQSLFTDNTISSPPGGPSSIYYGCRRIGIRYPYGVPCL